MGGIGNYTDPDRESLVRDQIREETNQIYIIHQDDTNNCSSLDNNINYNDAKTCSEPYVLISKEDLEFIKETVSKLCGIADNISYSCGDDEIAEEIDRIESAIIKKIDKLLSK